MDFLEFEKHDLYFDEPLSLADENLLKSAADAYPAKTAEQILLSLHTRMPESLIVIVALYRFYYYQHRYQEALDIAARALDTSSSRLNLFVDWSELTESHLGQAVFVSMGLIRFYLFSLKASAYLLLRTGETEQAHARLKKIVELDPADQFGARFLFNLAENELSVQQAQLHNIVSLFRR